MELAKAIDIAITEGLCGLVQLSNGVGITKYDLLELFRNIWNRQDIEILPYDGNGVDKSIAKSFRFSYSVPSYEKMLRDQFEWMQANQDLYNSLY